MNKLFGIPCPENQAEYCLLCNDRGDEEFCPCKAYNELPDEQKFPLDDLENYLYKQQES